MKQLFAFFSILLLLASCATELELKQSNPEETTMGFAEALYAGDYGLAQKYCTPAAAAGVLDLETYLKMSNEEEKTEMLKSLEGEAKKIDCQTTEGTTTCKVCCSTDGAEGEWELVQQNKKWYVSTKLEIKIQ
jgi:hypothetical protein